MSESRPVRIQRKRTKGWRMPANTVYVGRPTKWGNPFRLSTGAGAASRGVVRAEFVEFLNEDERGWKMVEEARRELRGKNLACWCPLDQPCHADVLLDLANQADIPTPGGAHGHSQS